MTTTAIRERLHHFIDSMDDKKAAAIYTLFEESIESSEEGYTDEFKAELDSRYAAYKKDGKLLSRAAMNERIGQLTGKP